MVNGPTPRQGDLFAQPLGGSSISPECRRKHNSLDSHRFVIVIITDISNVCRLLIEIRVIIALVPNYTRIESQL